MSYGLGIVMAERYFEDVHVGDKTESATYTFQEAELIEYSKKYDPQVFHTDHKEAEKSIFGAIVASGTHTMAISFRLFMEIGLFGRSNLGGFAIDEVRLLKPVRAGDTIQVRSEIIEARPSKSKRDRGIVRVLNEVVNQEQALVMRYTVGHLVRRRPTEYVEPAFPR